MSTSNNNTITDWKRLWQLVSGIHYETPENTVKQELFNVSSELQDGLQHFRQASASKTNLETLLTEKKQEKLLPFTQLQDLLDLESNQCWEILCNYLANEYRGSASSLSALISTEASMDKLLEDIWGYYTLERMIVLKIVKNLLIFYNVPNHPYQREYKEIIDKLTLSKLRDAYLKQLEQLINEKPPSKLTAGEFLNFHSKLIMWSERNAREINEVLHILLLICEDLPMELNHVKILFFCFKQHSFGKQQRYLNPAYSTHSELIHKMAYSEILLFLKCIDFEDPKASASLARDIIDAIDKDIVRMCHNPENGPLLFGWMILNLRCTKVAEDEKSFNRYRQFGKRAVDLDCFGYMYKMFTHSMFKDDSMVSRIARRTIYNLLTYMCNFFDEDGSCAQYPFIYELLCELLSWPTLAKEFCNRTHDGVRSLYSTLLEVFPVDFVHISMLANALTAAGMGEYIQTQLEALPILTDLYDEYKYPLRAIGEDEYVLTQSVCPYQHIDFTIPAGTTAAVMSRKEGYCVHFRISVNYFHVLHHEINCLLAETIHLHGDFNNSERVRRVESGLKYLNATLKRTTALTAISTAMVHPTEMSIDLLYKFKVVQRPPIGLLANCLNVCTALLPLVDMEIFTRIINLNVLPVITNTTLHDFNKYAQGMCFDSQLVGTYLMDVEKKLERFEFLTAYLGFLRAYTKLQRNRLFQVEIPGLIFLLREVFPHMHAWRFEMQKDKNKIYAEIMGFICDILDAVTSTADKDMLGNEKQMLRHICVYSLLSLENGLTLLRFIALGNSFLQQTMEMESNWMVQHSSGYVLLVRLAMRILMQLLRLKSTVFKCSELSPLEALIYTQPKQRDTLRIIPVVTSYMSNIFDRWLPILSCRLLKRIALEFNMSLLACLDMEPDQIRLAFLQKLPDDLESDSLKIAILELVEACIEKQPGVTEAFFKVNYAQEKRLFSKESNAQIGDSILTFVEDYLDAVAKEPQTIEHALPTKIMNLFHSLWKQNMQILVEDLTKKPTFWAQLCNPLFNELRPNVRAYTQLVNILGIEIFCSGNKANEDLKIVILKFFDQNYFDKWLRFVFDLPKTPIVVPLLNDVFNDDMPEWLCRLQAYKGFIIILLKKHPQFIEIPQKQYKLLAEKCLDTLVDRAQYNEDLRPFIILAEMYLSLILSFKQSYAETPEEERRMLLQLIKLLSLVATCYGDLHVRAKEACLSVAIKCADLLAEELVNSSTEALKFLHSVVSIICIELENLENCVKAEVKGEKIVEVALNSSTNSLVLSLNLLKTVANIFHNDGPGNWDLPFISNKVFQRLLSCTGSILQLFTKQNLSVELLDVLIVFAKGNCSTEFLHCDVGDYLWLKLLPPKDLLQTNYTLVQPCTDNWTVQKWWPIYSRGIEFATILFHKHSNYFLKEILQFVGIHEDYLMDSLLLGKQSLEPMAMALIKNAIFLISDMVQYEQQWRLEHPQSLCNLMRSVQMLMSHSVSMFHQPKNLRSLITGRRQLDLLRDSENTELVEEVITAFNDLTEIIILCVKCLQHFSPNLLDLICEHEFSPCKWERILDIHFGAPKLNENAFTLTFGTVLSIVGVYTKVLNLQNYGFHELPLNVLPSGINGDAVSSNVSQVPPNQTCRSSQRPFSKSLSITSVSSANCPPNELLSNLDGELCLIALEHILTLVASQSMLMLALKNLQLPPREKQLIKREISTELLTFQDFVRKKVLIDHREHRDMWHRRKHGLTLMHRTSVDTTPISSSSTKSIHCGPETILRHSVDLRNSMRVNVVRRMHLQQQQRAPSGGFEMSHIISPIGSIHGQEPVSADAITSTPHVLQSALRRSGDPKSDSRNKKRVHIVAEPDNLEEEEIEFFPPEEPTYSPLSYVQLVEEDYLHFMSNLFVVIGQSE